jgi:hypothetical protein
MTPKRTSSVLIALLVVASIAALWWQLSSKSATPTPSLQAQVTAPTIAISAAPVSSAASAASLAAAILSPRTNAADDPKCVVKTPPSPRIADADADANASDDATHPAADPIAPARAQLLARLRSSTDPYANAVAVWLDVGDADHRAERTRQLAAMAASTRDPRLYSLALRTCWGLVGRECQSLSARRWSELDPGNAMPWLLMLDEAAAHGDGSGQQEALFHITQSARLAERNEAPLQPIIDAVSGDADSLVAARALAIEAIGISAAQGGPGGYTACKLATPADANAWQQCVAMADLLEHRSDSLLARRIGASIDKKLTGNTKASEQVAAQMEDMLALDLASSSGCGDLRAKLADMRRIAVDGEASLLSR